MKTTNGSSIKQLLAEVCLIELLEDDKKVGSIFLPDNARPTHTGIRGRVLMIGKKSIHKAEVKIGDVVLVSKYLGTIIDKCNEYIRIYDDEDIIGVISNE